LEHSTPRRIESDFHLLQSRSEYGPGLRIARRHIAECCSGHFTLTQTPVRPGHTEAGRAGSSLPAPWRESFDRVPVPAGTDYCDVPIVPRPTHQLQQHWGEMVPTRYSQWVTYRCDESPQEVCWPFLLGSSSENPRVLDPSRAEPPGLWTAPLSEAAAAVLLRTERKVHTRRIPEIMLISVLSSDIRQPGQVIIDIEWPE
jgi:hypothetical protein